MCPKVIKLIHQQNANGKNCRRTRKNAEWDKMLNVKNINWDKSSKSKKRRWTKRRLLDNVDLKKYRTENTLTMGRVGKREKMLNLFTRELNILKLFKTEISCLTIRHYVPFGVYYIQHYF
jgi:hypothetical protein